MVRPYLNGKGRHMTLAEYTHRLDTFLAKAWKIREELAHVQLRNNNYHAQQYQKGMADAYLDIRNWIVDSRPMCEKPKQRKKVRTAIQVDAKHKKPRKQRNKKE